MLARASARAALATGSAVGRRSLASVNRATSVKDMSVSCTFILVKHNQRVTVPGMVGWSLLKTAHHHELPLYGAEADDPYDYNTFGEGPAGSEDHVVVQREYYDKTGPVGWQEENLLDEVEPENRSPTSRLAACITLTEELNGITVIVPEGNVDYSGYC